MTNIASKPVLYIIINKSLGMSPGKVAAQVAHATVGAVKISDPDALVSWFNSVNRWVIVLEADDDHQLNNLGVYLLDRDIQTYEVIDEGVNEIAPFSFTAVGVEILEKGSWQAELLSGLRKYQTDPEPLNLQAAYNTIGAFDHLNRRGKRVQRAWASVGRSNHGT